MRLAEYVAVLWHPATLQTDGSLLWRGLHYSEGCGLTMEPMATSPERAQGRWSAFRVYAEPPVARMLLLGFSAGLPLPLVLGTLSYRLREAGIDRTTIGFLSWVALAYAFKWSWAPIVDRVPLPVLTRVLGRRRSWLLLAQSAIALGLVGMAFSDPAGNLPRLVGFALFVAFSSATQDIALDAFRIESAEQARQAAMAAAYQVGYRAAMITASAGALWIAAAVDADESTYQHAPWNTAYLCMAGALSVGIVTVLFSRERPVEVSPETLAREQGRSWLYRAVASPVLDFVLRYRWRAALLLSLIAVYRISDIILGVMSNPFYRDMGFSKDEVATVSGVYGVLMTLAGAAVGGVLVLRMGVVRVLMLGATLSAMTNLLFAWLTTRGHDVPALVLVISADNLSGGIASAAFVAYLSSLTNVAYSATQYAIFSSLMVLLPKFLAGWSGWMVDHHGYSAFFIGTALIGVPVIVLAWLTSRLR
jgi:MFS transporter, PAT family, beta-lactamase induction signal transducer AmpG